MQMLTARCFLLASILSLCGYASAQGFATQLRQFEASESEYKQLKAAVENAQKAVSERQKEARSSGWGIFGSYFQMKTEKRRGQTVLVLDEEKITDAKSKLESDRDAIAKAEAGVGNALAGLAAREKELKDYLAGAKDLPQMRDALEASIRRASLSDKFRDLKSDIRDTNYILDRVSDALDQQMIGVYMRDKMHQMLNSNAMCSAVSKCEGGMRKNPAEDVKFSDMDEIFGNKAGGVSATERKRSGTP